MPTKKRASKQRGGGGSGSVYVVDAWDDDAQQSYVAVFSTRDKAVRDLDRWQAKRTSHDTYAGIVKRRVL